MLRKVAFVLAGMALLGLGVVGGALATPVIGVSAETARGPLVDRPLDVNMDFEGGGEVELKTKGPIEIANQRVVVAGGGTIGWHKHPGPTVVTILSGSMSFYHAEDCTTEIVFEPGDSFSNLPHEIHLAKNKSETEPLVFYAFYFVPAGTGSLRIDQPSPGPECPQ